MVRRIMTPYFYLQQNQYPPIDGEEPALNSNFPPYDYQFTLGAANVEVRDGHAQLIRELGSAGTVLLKNVNNTLPLSAPQTLGVFGNDAGDVVDGLYFSGSAFQNQYGYGKSLTHSLPCSFYSIVAIAIAIAISANVIQNMATSLSQAAAAQDACPTSSLLSRPSNPAPPKMERWSNTSSTTP